MATFQIHITGQVQGVGFRPFVYRMAKAHKLFGWVSNDVKGVHIEIKADQATASHFLHQLLKEAPPQSKIESYELNPVTNKKYSTFEIADSSSAGSKKVRLSPDFGLCKDCIDNLEDETNNRFRYPFTTCTNCGPRYSIINDLPYDRPYTEMEPFHMCDKCLAEYNNPEDRRFFSQTNSCPDCAVELEIFEHGFKQNLTQNQIITESIAALKRGEILAIKGVGGFLLLCDPANTTCIQRLRDRKNRPHKPFAILSANIESVKKNLVCTEVEANLLSSPSAPIVLLPITEGACKELATNEIAPQLDRIGVMLPCAPLLYLISKGFGRPLIATSGNVSGSPIVYNNKKALTELSRFAETIVTHNRNITIPQDDSVISYNHQSKAPIFLRRSRGFAPSYFGHLPKNLPSQWLGLGAQMKASFSLSTHGQIYASQYLGNLESFDAQSEFKHTYHHLRSVVDFDSAHIFADMHPHYFSHQWANETAKIRHVPATFIQHHKAHFAAVLQENELLESKKPILGVIWDGTGLGADGNIWGGEFFIYQNYEMKRAFHLQAFHAILGDKMVLEPRISALSVFRKAKEALPILREKFDDKEWKLYNQLLHHHHDINTTSIGRLFDAVASVLGLIDKSSFEGQGAMYLEVLARQAINSKSTAYPITIDHEQVLIHDLTEDIISDLNSEKPINEIAFKFHLTLVEMIRLTAKESGINRIAFSGGVFQNSLLIDLIVNQLGDDFEVFFHKELSPNDENISFGQLIYGYMMKKHKEMLQEQQMATIEV